MAEKIKFLKSGNKIGKLSQTVKEIIENNMSELSAIKGNLLSATKGVDVKTFLISSSKPGEGKTIAAISMALGLAALKSRVLLIDGNLRNPTLHQHFNIDVTPGLSDLFLSNADYNEVLHGTEQSELMVLPSGTKIYDSVEIFKSELFKKKLEDLKQMFDYVILDGHSILVSSDISLIAKYFDGTIIVVESEKTKREVVCLAKEKISNVGGNPIGAVLNRRKYYIPKVLYGNN